MEKSEELICQAIARTNPWLGVNGDKGKVRNQRI
jgi:hypothetical protein